MCDIVLLLKHPRYSSFIFVIRKRHMRRLVQEKSNLINHTITFVSY